MKTGMSYPSAYAAAYKGLGPDSTTVDLSKPNNILGYHYLSAAAQINDQLELFTIERKNTDYHDVVFTNESIASATAIRKSLHQHLNLDKIQPYIPETTLSELKDYQTVYGPVPPVGAILAISSIPANDDGAGRTASNL